MFHDHTGRKHTLINLTLKNLTSDQLLNIATKNIAPPTCLDGAHRARRGDAEHPSEGHGRGQAREEQEEDGGQHLDAQPVGEVGQQERRLPLDVRHEALAEALHQLHLRRRRVAVRGGVLLHGGYHLRIDS